MSLSESASEGSAGAEGNEAKKGEHHCGIDSLDTQKRYKQQSDEMRDEIRTYKCTY